VGQPSRKRETTYQAAQSAPERLYNSGEFSEALKEVSRIIKSTPQPSADLYLARILILTGLIKSVTKASAGPSQVELMKLLNADGIALALAAPKWPYEHSEKMGWIKKGGDLNPTKKMRWFILTHPLLFYYTKKEDTVPNGVIPVPLSLVRRTGSDKFAMQVPGRVYSLAEPKFVSQWIEAIQVRWNLVKQRSLTHFTC
jgi:hypothetical protein